MATQSHLEMFVRNWLRSRSKAALMLQGRPGTGKTAVIGRLAEEEGYQLVTLTPATLTPEGVQGLMFADRESKSAEFLALPDMAQIIGATSPVLMYVDDVIQGSKMVLNGLMALIHDRRLNGVKIPDCVKIILASNEAQDSCGAAAGSLPTAFTDRMILHRVGPEFEERMAYMRKVGYPVEIITFLNWHSDLFYGYNPNVPTNPTYRGWAKLADVMEFMGPSITPADCVACVGDSVGSLFAGFLATFARLANVQEILDHPERADKLTVEEKWAVMGLLENHFFKKEEAFDKSWAVIERLGPEYCMAETASILAREKVEADKRLKAGKSGFYEPFSSRPQMLKYIEKVLDAMASAPAK